MIEKRKYGARLDFFIRQNQVQIIFTKNPRKSAQFMLHVGGHKFNGTLQAVIGVRGTDETCMGLARLIHDLHPDASAP